MGNVVTPDEAAEKYGAEALRVYEMFVAPFEETVQWSEEAFAAAQSSWAGCTGWSLSKGRALTVPLA